MLVTALSLVLTFFGSMTQGLDEDFKAKILERLAQEESMISGLRKEIYQIREDNNKMKDSIQRIVSQGLPNLSTVQHLRGIRAASQNGDSFYARLNHSIHAPSDGFTITYDNVVPKNGSGFSNHGTGIFRAHSGGFYFFTWTTAVGTNQQIKSDLVKNGLTLASSITPSSTGSVGSGTGSAIVKLLSDDELWIRVSEVNQNNRSLSSTTIKDQFTTFAGFKIN